MTVVHKRRGVARVAGWLDGYYETALCNPDRYVWHRDASHFWREVTCKRCKAKRGKPKK